MYLLTFYFIAAHLGQSLDMMSIEEIGYATYATRDDCIHNAYSQAETFKHKLLTEYQSVPYFTFTCDVAQVFHFNMPQLDRDGQSVSSSDEHPLKGVNHGR